MVKESGSGDQGSRKTTWECTPGDSGHQTCLQLGQDMGLPIGGSDWKCNRTSKENDFIWVCYGTAASQPTGDGWVCERAQGESGKWRCKRPEQPGDLPPDGQWWACVKGSEYGGTRCEAVDQEPRPADPEAVSGVTCLPGERRWCDGLQYAGWGQITCDATGAWPTKQVNGKLMLDCEEPSSGRRPNTDCACYHFYYNGECCERPDCMVPHGTEGQLCEQSGGGLCSYCNPQKPECVEAEARCVVTNDLETFCGRKCSVESPCSVGYICQEMKLQTGIDHQCVPEDFSCYY